MNKLVCLALTVILGCGSAWSQEAQKQVTLPVGSRVLFMLPQDLTSATVQPEREINAVVSEPVLSGGCEVIPKGSEVRLFVTKARKSAGGGGAGILEISNGKVLDSTGHGTSFNFHYRSKGKSYLGMTIPMAFVGGLFIPVFGLGLPLAITACTLHGTEGTISGNTIFTGLTSSEITAKCP